jgi:hypothetical protein
MMRERAKIKQAAAARIIGISPQGIGRLEDGQSTRVNDLFLNALCDAYQATDEERQIVLALAAEVRAAAKHGGRWWRGYADEIPAGFDHYLALEEAASHITAWKAAIVPGLLQTPDYRRAVIWTESPELSPDAVEKRIEMAGHRQARLEDPDLTVDVLVSETVIRDRIGGRGVMESQLYHLAEVGTLPNVSVRVVPFETHSHLGSITGSFVLLEFPILPSTKLTEPPVVYVESYLGGLYLEREAEVEQYRKALGHIQRVALAPDETRRMILAAAKECRE